MIVRVRRDNDLVLDLEWPAIWHSDRSNAGGGINPGVALAGDRVFMVTDNAHIIALNRFTGDLLWETEMADWHLNYKATSAPLIVGDLVVNGSSGGDEGVRGFLAAFDQKTGKYIPYDSHDVLVVLRQ